MRTNEMLATFISLVQRFDGSVAWTRSAVAVVICTRAVPDERNHLSAVMPALVAGMTSNKWFNMINRSRL